MIGTRQLRSALLASLSLGLLAACGPMPEETPPTATAPAVTDQTPATATPPGALLTFGNLATRVNAAWRDTGSYRIAISGGTMPAPMAPASPIASPMATPMATLAATPVTRTPSAYLSVREVVLPDLQRQEVTGLGADDHEAIATADGIFVRGPLAEKIAPGTPEGTWIVLDPAEIPAGSTLSILLGGLPNVPPAPLSQAPQRLWPQQLRDLGEVEFDGRACQIYGAADTVAATGMRIDYAIAVDEAGVPCFVETSATGTVERRDEYTNIGEPLEIVAPEEATPADVPPALAEEAHHD